MYDAADQLFQRVRVFNAEKLADLDRQGQLDECPVRIHDQRMSLFRCHVSSRAFSEYGNG